MFTLIFSIKSKRSLLFCDTEMPGMGRRRWSMGRTKEKKEGTSSMGHRLWRKFVPAENDHEMIRKPTVFNLFFWICESLDSFFVSESICCCSRGSLSNRKWTNFQRLFMNMLRLSRTLSTRKWQARLILTKRWPIMTQDGERTSNMLMQFKCFKTAKAKFRFNEKSVG